MKFKALKKFPYSPNGIKTVGLEAGDIVEVEKPDSIKTLIKHGYFEEVKEVDVVEKVEKAKQPKEKSEGESPKNKMFSGSPKDKKEKVKDSDE